MCPKSLFVGAFTFIALSASAADRLKVLIIDGQNNHKWDITTPVLVNALDSSGAFTTEVSTTPAKGSPAEAWKDWHPDFAQYSAVVSNYNGEPWPEAVRLAFDAYMKNGGGFVSVHAADNSFPEWKEYKDRKSVV